MLMLKMLELKLFKKYINICIDKCKLSLFGRDDAKQAKSLIFIVVPQVGPSTIYHIGNKEQN